MEKSSLKKNFAWNTVGSVVLYACQWLVSILVVNLSTPSGVDNVGLLQLGITASQTFVSLASYGMRSFQVSDLTEKYSPSCYIRSRCLTVCGAYLACGLFCVILSYSALQTVTILLYLLYRLTESISDVYHGMAQRHDHMEIIGKGYILRGIGSTVVFAVLLVLTNNIPLTVFGMAVVSYGILFFYEVPQCKHYYDPKATTAPHSVQRLLWECLPLAVYTFLNTAIVSTPKLFLEKLASEEILGIYNSVTAPVLLLQTVATYLFVPLIAHFADAYTHRDAKRFYKTTLVVAGLMLVMIPMGLLVVRFMGVWGLNFLYPNKGYDAYVAVLYPVVFASVLTALVLFLGMLLTVMRAMKMMLAANIAGIAATLVISAPLIHWQPMQGTCLATIAALCVQTLVLTIGGFVLAQKHFHEGPQETQPE